MKLLSDEQYSAELGCLDNEIENIFENPDTFEVKNVLKIIMASRLNILCLRQISLIFMVIRRK